MALSGDAISIAKLFSEFVCEGARAACAGIPASHRDRCSELKITASNATRSNAGEGVLRTPLQMRLLTESVRLAHWQDLRLMVLDLTGCTSQLSTPCGRPARVTGRVRANAVHAYRAPKSDPSSVHGCTFAVDEGEQRI